MAVDDETMRLGGNGGYYQTGRNRGSECSRNNNQEVPISALAMAFPFLVRALCAGEFLESIES